MSDLTALVVADRGILILEAQVAEVENAAAGTVEPTGMVVGKIGHAIEAYADAAPGAFVHPPVDVIRGPVGAAGPSKPNIEGAGTKTSIKNNGTTPTAEPWMCADRCEKQGTCAATSTRGFKPQ